jgi:hypothetical protein
MHVRCLHEISRMIVPSSVGASMPVPGMHGGGGGGGELFKGFSSLGNHVHLFILQAGMCHVLLKKTTLRTSDTGWGRLLRTLKQCPMRERPRYYSSATLIPHGALSYLLIGSVISACRLQFVLQARTRHPVNYIHKGYPRSQPTTSAFFSTFAPQYALH